MTASAASVAAVQEVLRAHNIECTGLGEVTCRGCRDEGWMPWGKYREHVAVAAADAAVQAATPGIQAGALREAADEFEEFAYVDDRQFERVNKAAVRRNVASILRDRADRIEAPDAS